LGGTPDLVVNGRSNARAIHVTVEAAPKKAFATAVDWPGWSRSGKTEELALAALAAAAHRYATVAREAHESFSSMAGNVDAFEVIERTDGGGGTDFGVPSAITDLDHRPLTAKQAERLIGLVEAAWAVFDRVAAAAPAELRKGPRGGGRDRDRIVDHVDGADHAYAQVMGIKVAAPDRKVPTTVKAMRAAMLDALRGPSDGSPIAGRKWPPRYAARRIAWHALDHAWEIQDRTEPEAER
jgi:hypothetical protein